MNSAFNGQILADKLSKLNNSQQSIETLSHWCIFHRKKAKQVVETWDRQFHNSLREQRVPFLYLANDILQNSRRKGTEFVGEFWKVLPGVLKDVYENGDDYGKNVVFRLIDIWEERKVFGSRGRSLREEMLGKDPPPTLENNGRGSHSIKIVRKTPHSVKIKLAVGGTPEKIVSAFQAVHDGHIDEDAILNKCKAAFRRVEKMDKDVEDACGTGHLKNSSLPDNLEEQELVLRQSIEQLENSEMTRAALVAQLKEALQEQESKLEQVRTQLQVAQGQLEQTESMRQRLNDATTNGKTSSKQTATNAHAHQDTNPTISRENHSATEKDHATSSVSMAPTTSLAESTGIVDVKHKKTASSVAAEVAAKLAASTSSAQMLTSVLSSLAAEEAASMTGGLRTTSLPVETSSGYPPEKRAKLGNHFSNSDGGSPYVVHQSPAPLNSTPMQHQAPVPSQLSPMQHQSVSMQQQPLPNTVQHQTSPPMQHPTSSPMTHQASPMQHQPPYPPPPPPPPPPPLIQYMPGSSNIVGMPYGYGSNLPPPPPLVGHPMIGMPRPAILQQSVPPGPYQPLQPPGMGFYSQPPLPAPPIPRH